MTIKADLLIDAGTTFSIDLSVVDENEDVLNLSESEIIAQMKRWYTSSNTINFNATINSVSGIINLSLDANTTASLDAGRYVYDVKLITSDIVTRFMEGYVTVTPEVSSNE